MSFNGRKQKGVTSSLLRYLSLYGPCKLPYPRIPFALDASRYWQFVTQRGIIQFDPPTCQIKINSTWKYTLEIHFNDKKVTRRPRASVLKLKKRIQKGSDLIVLASQQFTLNSRVASLRWPSEKGYQLHEGPSDPRFIRKHARCNFHARDSGQRKLATFMTDGPARVTCRKNGRDIERFRMPARLIP